MGLESVDEGRRSCVLEFLKLEHGDSATEKPRDRLPTKERQPIGEASMHTQRETIIRKSSTL